MEPGSCPVQTCGLEGHLCGGLDRLKLLSRQHKQLVMLFRNLEMKTKTATEVVADCHGETEVNPVTVLRFCSMFRSLESILGLGKKHEVVNAFSVVAFSGVLQAEQKFVGR